MLLVTRRVVTHKSKNVDNDMLTVVTIFETGCNKVKAKKEIPWSKRHQVLVKRRDKYDFK